MVVEAASPGASSVPLVLCDAGGRRPLQEQASSASGVGRRTTRSEPCVGNAEDIAEEEWALKLGTFPVCSVLLILFDSSSLLLLRRRLRLRSDVS